MDNFHETDHKVECRNYEFEEYLKKNQLYILNGKKHSRLKSEGLEDENVNNSRDTFEKYHNERKVFRKTPLKGKKKNISNFERIMKMGMKERLKYYEELSR